MIGREVFGDLRLVVGAFVDRDADLAVGARHRLGAQPGQLTLDVEIADLAEIEELFVKPGPQRHAALVHVVGQMVDRTEPDPGRRHARDQGHEIDIVDRVFAVAVDEVDEAAADPLDRRDVELHRPDLAVHRLGAEPDRPVIGRRRVLDPERDRADRGPMQPGKRLGKALGLGIDDEIDPALAVERDVLSSGAAPPRQTPSARTAPPIAPDPARYIRQTRTRPSPSGCPTTPGPEDRSSPPPMMLPVDVGGGRKGPEAGLRPS